VNTARAFGPAVVTGFPYGTQWVVRMTSFTTSPSSHITLVLGWSVPWIVPGSGILHDS
jgi:hypothetical protein